MYLETQRIFIRDFKPEDVADLYEILGDSETMEHSELPYSFEKTKRFLAEFCIDRKSAFAAMHKENNKVIGYILFSSTEDGVYEIGWFFNRLYWGQGFAYEACRALVTYAFQELHAHKIFAESTDPVKSVPLMQKLGMMQEGIQRRHTKDNKVWSDLYLYGLLEEDFFHSKADR